MKAPQGMSRQSSLIAAGGGRPGAMVLIALAIMSGIALATAIGFWLHYGTAVFFQMLAAGFAACF